MTVLCDCFIDRLMVLLFIASSHNESNAMLEKDQNACFSIGMFNNLRQCDTGLSTVGVCHLNHIPNWM